MKRTLISTLALLAFAVCFGQNSAHDPGVSPTRLGVAINLSDFALYDFNTQVLYRPTSKFGVMAYFAHGNARNTKEPSPSMEEFRYEIGPRWYVSSENLIFVQATFSYVDANFWTESEGWELVNRNGSNYYTIASRSNRDDIFQTGLNLSLGSSFKVYRFVYMEIAATYGYRWSSVSQEWKTEFDGYSGVNYAGYSGPLFRLQFLMGINLL